MYIPVLLEIMALTLRHDESNYGVTILHNAALMFAVFLPVWVCHFFVRVLTNVMNARTIMKDNIILIKGVVDIIIVITIFIIVIAIVILIVIIIIILKNDYLNLFWGSMKTNQQTFYWLLGKPHVELNIQLHTIIYNNMQLHSFTYNSIKLIISIYY